MAYRLRLLLDLVAKIDVEWNSKKDEKSQFCTSKETLERPWL